MIVETEQSTGSGGARFAALSVASSAVTLAAALALRENGWNGWAIVALAAVLIGLITGGVGIARARHAGRMLAVAGLVLNVLLGGGLLVWLAWIVSGLE